MVLSLKEKIAKVLPRMFIIKSLEFCLQGSLKIPFKVLPFCERFLLTRFVLRKKFHGDFDFLGSHTHEGGCQWFLRGQLIDVLCFAKNTIMMPTIQNCYGSKLCILHSPISLLIAHISFVRSFYYGKPYCCYKCL